MFRAMTVHDLPNRHDAVVHLPGLRQISGQHAPRRRQSVAICSPIRWGGTAVHCDGAGGIGLYPGARISDMWDR